MYNFLMMYQIGEIVAAVWNVGNYNCLISIIVSFYRLTTTLELEIVPVIVEDFIKINTVDLKYNPWYLSLSYLTGTYIQVTITVRWHNAWTCGHRYKWVGLYSAS